MKKLVVYYSLEGNTKLMAESIAAVVGADLLALILKKEISAKGFMKFFWGGKQVLLKEKPELYPLDKNVDDYDVLFIGTPVWAWTYAPALATFFEMIKLKNKKIALFCCSGGGKGKTIDNMKQVLAGNEIIGEIDFLDPLKHNKENDVEQVKKWAQGLNL